MKLMNNFFVVVTHIAVSLVTVIVLLETLLVLKNVQYLISTPGMPKYSPYSYVSNTTLEQKQGQVYALIARGI